MRGTCAVQLLSAFQVEVDGRPVPASAWRHRRGAELVKLLALAPAHGLHREELMDRLWPELAADAAAANLRKAVHYARQALGGREAIAADGEMLMLWPAGELRVDAEIVEAESRKALATATGLEAAADLFTGDLLPADRYAGWTEPHRERLRRRRLEVLRAAARWEQVLDLEGTDEEACRALMRRHLEVRDRRAAIREFQRLREILRVDLGVAPEPATVALFEEAIAVETAEPPRSAERAQALLARGLMHWSWRELDPAEKLAQGARDLAMEGHLGRELGEASSLLGMVAFARGRWLEHFRQEFTEALRLSTERAPFVLDAQLCLVQVFLTTADSKTVTGLARELLDAAVDAGSVPGEAAMSLLMGESQLLAGNLDEAREWLSRAAGMYEDLDGASGRAFSLVRLAEVANADGRQAEATRQLIVARALADRSELVSHLLPRVFAAMIRTAGNAERRRRVLSDAGGAMRPKEVCGPCSIGLRVAATTACARSGDRAQARKWLTDAERIASMWQGTAWEAAVWEARAELRRAEGDDAQAKALLREAAELFAERGRPLDEARCLAGIG
jgi:DNA-binding SARP family transcriptional activator